MSTLTSCIKTMLLATIPSLLLGAVAYAFIAMCTGAQGLRTVDGIWYFVTFVSFLYLLSTHNDGKQIFGRSLRYFAYEVWLLPVFLIVYFIVSGSQFTPQDRALGAAIGTIGAIIITSGASVIAGLVGLVFYLISKNLLKKPRKHLKRHVAQPVQEQV